MITVHRYDLDLGQLDDLFRIHVPMPWDAELLHVAETTRAGQKTVTVWARVDATRPQFLRRLFVIGTGGVCPWKIEARHVRSVVMSDGHVWHVFDGGEIEPAP